MTVLHQKRELLALLLEEELGYQHGGERITPGQGVGESTPLSFAQERLWFLEQLEPDSSSYNLASLVTLDSKVRLSLLEQSFQCVMDRHETLRTRFREVDQQPVQYVLPKAPFTLSRVDLRDLAGGEEVAQIEQQLTRLALSVFDLERGYLIRAAVLLSGERRILLVLLHHIISDDWSSGILVREIASCYQSLAAGRAPDLAPLPIQYRDFAVWQRRNLSGERLQKLLAVWRRSLGDELPDLELPTDRPRSARPSFAGGVWSLALPTALTRRLEGLNRRYDTTLFMTTLAAFAVLLWTVSAQRRLLVGTTISNRNRPEIESLIGFFVNTLVLRIDVAEELSFEALLGQVKATCLEAFNAQDLPFELLVRELQPSRDLSRNPIFQVMFSLQNAYQRGTVPGDLFQPMAFESGRVQFDLNIDLAAGESDTSGEGDVYGRIDYRADLFDRTTIGRLARHFEILLEQVTRQPEQALGALTVVDDCERHQLLFEWHGSQSAPPIESELLHECIARQAVKRPHGIAVVDGDGYLSYGTMDLRATSLAEVLRFHGVEPEVTVALLLPRTLGLAVAILATLKAGGTYIPLDPAEPRQRLEWMLEDCRAGLLLAESPVELAIPDETRWLDPSTCQLSSSERTPTRRMDPDHAAYAIYTSGSSGRPKAALISHRSVVGYALDFAARLNLRPDRRMLQFAALSFDVVVEELFPTWLAGATVVLRPREAFGSAEFQDFLAVHRIDLIELPTAFWNEWVRYLESVSQAPPKVLRRVIVGGEHPLPERLDYWRRVGPTLSNIYGLTEVTVTSTLLETDAYLTGRTPLPIGRPLLGTQVYVLDRRLQLVPIGVTGEIYLAGPGLGRGYLRRPALTASRWLGNPWSRLPGERMYRTGDLARWLADGQLEILGRRDEQMKIRGFRVEPSETEAALSELQAVASAAVALRKVGDSVHLVAYLVAQSGEKTLQLATLRSELGDRLPGHMIPTVVVALESLPLTTSGKVDRRALPEPELQQVEIEAARGPVEEALAEIWAEILGRDRVGRDENFFDLGGHSLLATRLITRVREAMQVELPLRRLFLAPTVAGLALAIEELVREGVTDALPMIERVSRSGHLPLSYAQYRLWLYDQLEPGLATYNVPLALRIEGDVDLGILERSLQHLVKRHEILRTTFVAERGEPRQEIHCHPQLVCTLVDLQDLDSDSVAAARGAVLQEARRPFDLSRGPLLRGLFVQLAERDLVLLLVVHHIACDGWTMGLMIEELLVTYRALEKGNRPKLPELAIQYADFAAWQRAWLSEEHLERQLNYWQRELAGASDFLALPTDRPRPRTRRYRGAACSFQVAGEIAQPLKQLAREEGGTLFMVLAAALQLLLYRLSGQEDILVGTAVANRQRAELETLFGFLVNTVVLRGRMNSESSFRQLLEQTRESVLGAYAHQDVPFERVLEHLGIGRELDRSPLFQVMFEFENAPRDLLQTSEWTLHPFEVGTRTAKFDLFLEMSESGEGLTGTLEYDTDLFSERTALSLIEHFEHLLAVVGREPESPLLDLPLAMKRSRPRPTLQDAAESFAFGD